MNKQQFEELLKTLGIKNKKDTIEDLSQAEVDDFLKKRNAKILFSMTHNGE